jgi:hypothetical protein
MGACGSQLKIPDAGATPFTGPPVMGHARDGCLHMLAKQLVGKKKIHGSFYQNDDYMEDQP